MAMAYQRPTQERYMGMPTLQELQELVKDRIRVIDHLCTALQFVLCNVPLCGFSEGYLTKCINVLNIVDKEYDCCVSCFKRFSAHTSYCINNCLVPNGVLIQKCLYSVNRSSEFLKIFMENFAPPFLERVNSEEYFSVCTEFARRVVDNEDNIVDNIHRVGWLLNEYLLALEQASIYYSRPFPHYPSSHGGVVTYGENGSSGELYRRAGPEYSRPSYLLNGGHVIDYRNQHQSVPNVPNLSQSQYQSRFRSTYINIPPDPAYNTNSATTTSPYHGDSRMSSVSGPSNNQGFSNQQRRYDQPNDGGLVSNVGINNDSRVSDINNLGNNIRNISRYEQPNQAEVQSNNAGRVSNMGVNNNSRVGLTNNMKDCELRLIDTILQLPDFKLGLLAKLEKPQNLSHSELTETKDMIRNIDKMLREFHSKFVVEKDDSGVVVGIRRINPNRNSDTASRTLEQRYVYQDGNSTSTQDVGSVRTSRVVGEIRVVEYESNNANVNSSLGRNSSQAQGQSVPVNSVNKESSRLCERNDPEPSSNMPESLSMVAMTSQALDRYNTQSLQEARYISKYPRLTGLLNPANNLMQNTAQSGSCSNIDMQDYSQSPMPNRSSADPNIRRVTRDRDLSIGQLLLANDSQYERSSAQQTILTNTHQQIEPLTNSAQSDAQQTLQIPCNPATDCPINQERDSEDVEAPCEDGARLFRSDILLDDNLPSDNNEEPIHLGNIEKYVDDKALVNIQHLQRRVEYQKSGVFQVRKRVINDNVPSTSNPNVLCEEEMASDPECEDRKDIIDSIFQDSCIKSSSIAVSPNQYQECVTTVVILGVENTEVESKFPLQLPEAESNIDPEKVRIIAPEQNCSASEEESNEIITTILHDVEKDIRPDVLQLAALQLLGNLVLSGSDKNLSNKIAHLKTEFRLQETSNIADESFIITTPNGQCFYSQSPERNISGVSVNQEDQSMYGSEQQDAGELTKREIIQDVCAPLIAGENEARADGGIFSQVHKKSRVETSASEDVPNKYQNGIESNVMKDALKVSAAVKRACPVLDDDEDVEPDSPLPADSMGLQALDFYDASASIDRGIPEQEMVIEIHEYSYDNDLSEGDISARSDDVSAASLGDVSARLIDESARLGDEGARSENPSTETCDLRSGETENMEKQSSLNSVSINVACKVSLLRKKISLSNTGSPSDTKDKKNRNNPIEEKSIKDDNNNYDRNKTSNSMPKNSVNNNGKLVTKDFNTKLDQETNKPSSSAKHSNRTIVEKCATTVSTGPVSQHQSQVSRSSVSSSSGSKDKSNSVSKSKRESEVENNVKAPLKITLTKTNSGRVWSKKSPDSSHEKSKQNAVNASSTRGSSESGGNTLTGGNTLSSANKVTHHTDKTIGRNTISAKSSKIDKNAELSNDETVMKSPMSNFEMLQKKGILITDRPKGMSHIINPESKRSNIHDTPKSSASTSSSTEKSKSEKVSKSSSKAESTKNVNVQQKDGEAKNHPPKYPNLLTSNEQSNTSSNSGRSSTSLESTASCKSTSHNTHNGVQKRSEAPKQDSPYLIHASAKEKVREMWKASCYEKQKQPPWRKLNLDVAQPNRKSEASKSKEQSESSDKLDSIEEKGGDRKRKRSTSDMDYKIPKKLEPYKIPKKPKLCDSDSAGDESMDPISPLQRLSA